jgi:hypothetical protein
VVAVGDRLISATWPLPPSAFPTYCAAAFPPESLLVVIALVIFEVSDSPVSTVITGMPSFRQVLMAGAIAVGSVGETIRTFGCLVQTASTIGVWAEGAKSGEPW